MNLITRRGDARRSYPSVEFPLQDCQGLFVVKDRRRLSDRRKADHKIANLKVMLLKILKK